MFFAEFDKKRGWRIRFDSIDICGAVNEAVARETVMCLVAYRAVHP